MAKSGVEAAIEAAKQKLKVNIDAGAFGPAMGHTVRIWDLRRLAYSHEIREGCDPLDPNCNEHYWLRVIPNEDFLKDMVEWARNGDGDAHRIACELIGLLIEDDEPLPRILREYLLDVLSAEFEDGRDAGRRGWDPVGHYARDQCIRDVVNELVAVHGLSRTRNPATEKPSACSIASQALSELGVSLSEKTIAEITSPRN